MRSSLPRRLLRSPWLYVAMGLGALGLIFGLLAATWLYDHDDRVRFRPMHRRHDGADVGGGGTGSGEGQRRHRTRSARMLRINAAIDAA